jgi:hypothetical protein
VTRSGLSNLTVRDIAVRDFGGGVDLTSPVGGPVDGATVSGVTATRTGTALAVGNATGLAVTNLSVRSADTGVHAQTTAGTLANATVRNTTRPFTARGNASALTVIDFATDTGVFLFTAARAGLGSSTGPNESSVTVENGTVETIIARANVTGNGTAGRLSATVPYPATVNDSRVGLYERTPSRTYAPLTSVGGAAVGVDPATDELSARLVPGRRYAVLAVNDTTRDPTDGNTTLPLGERLFPNGIPGGSGDAPPTDPDGDGILEDLDGDGAFRFVDVIEFVFALSKADYSATALTDEQLAAVDFDGNGRVDFVDVIELVFQV